MSLMYSVKGTSKKIHIKVKSYLLIQIAGHFHHHRHHRPEALVKNSNK